MTIDAPLDMRPAAVPSAPVNGLLASPILPTLLKLALPNAIAMVGTTLVAVAETSYIGRLGTEPLAGIALVFPFVMLTQMMSAGAMGGGVSSAISRALGAGDKVTATATDPSNNTSERSWKLAMAAPSFSGASALRLSFDGSSRLIDSRSDHRPASSISHGLASGMVLRWI